MNLNVGAKTIKLLDINIEKIRDLGVGKYFFNRAPKSLRFKEG